MLSNCQLFAVSGPVEGYRIFQTDCSALGLYYSADRYRSPETKMDFQIDGIRHETGGVFWATYWYGDKLVREP